MININEESLSVALDWLEEHPVEFHKTSIVYLITDNRDLIKILCSRLPSWKIPGTPVFPRFDYSQMNVICQFLGITISSEDSNPIALSEYHKKYGGLVKIDPSEKAHELYALSRDVTFHMSGV